MNNLKNKIGFSLHIGTAAIPIFISFFLSLFAANNRAKHSNNMTWHSLEPRPPPSLAHDDKHSPPYCRTCRWRRLWEPWLQLIIILLISGAISIHSPNEIGWLLSQRLRIFLDPLFFFSQRRPLRNVFTEPDADCMSTANAEGCSLLFSGQIADKKRQLSLTKVQINCIFIKCGGNYFLLRRYIAISRYICIELVSLLLISG